MPRAGPLATSLLVLFAGGAAAVAAAEVTAAPAARSTPDDDAARWTSWVDWPLPDSDRHTVAFPVGEIFTPPLADQKQPRFHTTLQLWKTAGGDFTVGSVAYGENLPLLRWPSKTPGNGWQLGVSGAVFAIFNLDTDSSDLLNADYMFGLPLSWRRGALSARGRYFHQSSHLGDEFLLNTAPGLGVERINLSFEAIELLVSWEKDGWRTYGGGSRIVRAEPGIGRQKLQVGLEYRGRRTLWRAARLIAGLDVQSWEETDWDRDYSFKVGLAFRSPYGGPRSLQTLLEYYDGHAPHGQFYPLEVDYVGLGLAFSF